MKYQRPIGPTSMQRIRQTPRIALNAAIRQELIAFNAAEWVEMPPAPNAKPMVWTPQQTGAFLDHAVHDRLPALPPDRLPGPPRGEAREATVVLDAATIAVLIAHRSRQDAVRAAARPGWRAGWCSPNPTAARCVAQAALRRPANPSSSARAQET